MKTITFRKTTQQLVFVALCTAALSALPVMAQDTTTPPPAGQGHMHGDPAEREQKKLDFMTKKLSLTPDQVTQVKAIDDDEHTQAMALRNDTSVAQTDKRAKMMDIHKASSDKIRAVLNDDQKTKYDAMQAKAQERWQNREGSAPPPPPQ